MFGLFRVNKTRFVIMENLLYFIRQPSNAVYKYDLKGSERNRFSKTVNGGETRMTPTSR